MKMKRTIVLLTILLALFLMYPGMAQDGDDRLKVNLRRDFGYSAGGRIQGRFTVSAVGPDDLEKVRYLLDGDFMAEVSGSPFKYSFSTGDYAIGVHTLTAVGTRANGVEIFAEEVSLEFISAEDSWQRATEIVIPLAVGIGVIMVLGVLMPILMGRRSGSFVLGNYGPAGGVVCPGCSFPYSRHFLSPNLVIGKLERCPHCGKWAIVPRASRASLDEAEARYRIDAETGVLEQDDRGSPAEKERQLDDTRYFDI
jgi:hypothetical protein